MKLKLFYLLQTAFFVSVFSIPLIAQHQKATAFEIKKEGEYFGGELFITVNGKQQKIAAQANDVWLVNDGKQVVYSGRDGAGGFENEGQSLRIYEVNSGKTRKIMSEYSMIIGLSAKRLSTGQDVLLVRMEDGGLGASYFAVVDPKRGEVFHRSAAEIIGIKGDTVRLGFYKEEDWERINGEKGTSNFENKTAFPTPSKVKPYKTESVDLKKIIKNKVIYNKPTNEYLEVGLKRVKIYLWRANDDEGSKPFVLGTVEREVNSATPLQPALQELFLGAAKYEEENGFSSSTFGMKFEGVVLKNGLATVKFSQPKNQTNYGSAGPLIFLAAIEKTAKQFPGVRKVEVCAVGETLIDAQLEKQFPRCK